MKVSLELEKWYHDNKRNLPWRNTRSPYHIWLSEIILQQTRVSQGLAYYHRFIEKYPSVSDLADAPLDEVLKLWQGLGYYARARYLHETARIIANDLNGTFPGTFKELIRLKGIGTYTAAAIASIAFREPVALVDGNVSRVLARLYGIEVPVNSMEGRQTIHRQATALLNRARPDIHNQAMMEFGALVCVPRKPDCGSCVLSQICVARKDGLVGILPKKENRIKSRNRYFYYLFARFNGHTFLRRRTGNDIWNSLYEFPLIESDKPLSEEELRSHPLWKRFRNGNDMPMPGPPRAYTHRLTHQTLYCFFYQINTGGLPAFQDAPYLQVSEDSLADYAIPRIIDRYLVELRHERLL